MVVHIIWRYFAAQPDYVLPWREAVCRGLEAFDCSTYVVLFVFLRWNRHEVIAIVIGSSMIRRFLRRAFLRRVFVFCGRRFFRRWNRHEIIAMLHVDWFFGDSSISSTCFFRRFFLVWGRRKKKENISTVVFVVLWYCVRACVPIRFGIARVIKLFSSVHRHHPGRNNVRSIGIEIGGSNALLTFSSIAVTQEAGGGS